MLTRKEKKARNDAKPITPTKLESKSKKWSPTWEHLTLEVPDHDH